MTPEDLGFGPTWRFHLDELGEPGLIPGRILRVDRGACLVWTEAGPEHLPWRAPLPVSDGDTVGQPATGDWCALAHRSDTLVLRAILPRRTLFARGQTEGRPSQAIAANIDVAFLVTGLDGDFNPRRVERYLALSRTAGARPVIVLNKADLCDSLPEHLAKTEAVARGVPVLVVSAHTGEGMAELAAELPPGLTGVLLGSSGAGKSSLINRLLGEEHLATSEVREDDSKGRHTTTHRVLLPLPGGGVVIDTPGMREVGLLGDGEGLDETFDEISALAGGCRFVDCEHQGEPGCAVQAAAETGEIDADRLERYLALRKETESARRRASVHEQRHHEKTTIGRWRKQVVDKRKKR